ncbi:MAG: T9SS type A sorting domain-containing protein [Bacteroidota bacterium]
MKKSFTLLLCALPFFAFGQDYTFAFGADSLVFANAGDFIIADGKVKNLLSETRNYTWTLDSVDAPDDWSFYICDKNVCYTPATTQEHFFLDASEEGIFKLNVVTGTAAMATAYMTIFMQEDSTQIIHQEVQINTLLSDIDPLLEAGVSMAQNAPNPTSGATVVAVDLKGRIGEIRVADLTGRSVQIVPLSGTTKEIEIANELPAGVYFYTLWMEGRPIISRKMQVQ